MTDKDALIAERETRRGYGGVKVDGQFYISASHFVRLKEQNAYLSDALTKAIRVLELWGPSPPNKPVLNAIDTGYAVLAKAKSE